MIASIILLSFIFIDLGFYLAKHGEPKTGKYNFLVALISSVIMLSLYYYAGVFENFK